MVHKKRAIEEFNRRNDHQMIATSEFKSDLVNIVYLRHVFEKHFSADATFGNDSDKEDQEMMIDKFNIYEQ